MTTGTEELPEVANRGAGSQKHNRYVRLGDFAIDTNRKALLKSGRPLLLSPKCCDLLLFLIDKKGNLATRDELGSHFWSDIALAARDKNLNTAVSQIRRALAGANPIGTIRGKGYVLEGSVTYSDVVEKQIETPTPIMTPALARGPAVNRLFGRIWSSVELAFLGVGSLLLGTLLGTASYSLWWIYRLRH